MTEDKNTGIKQPAFMEENERHIDMGGVTDSH